MKTYELASVLIFTIFWLSVYFFEVRYLVASLRKEAGPRYKFQIIIHFLAIVGISCLIYGYFIEPYWIDVRHVGIETDKLKQADLTIVQISDLHCDKKIRNETKLADIINALDPDVVVFTGDALNTPRSLPVFKKMMSDIRARMGKYAVRGNFDVWYRNKLDLFRGTGFIELDGQSATLAKNNEKFTISGLSVDARFGDLSFLDILPPDAYNILIFHYPGINEEISGSPIDLFLSGHTHGGQIALPFYGALITLSKYGKKYESGRYDIFGKVLYVNRGIGMEAGIAPRVRFFARPEVTVFHIKPKSDKP
jgi:predicted MPP superfamily phosphohydrolase